jgi:hypothetical protein
MNANEISPKANARLKRIKIASRILKVLFLLYFACAGYFLPFVHKMPDGVWLVPGGAYATIQDIPLISKLVIGLGAGLILAATITCYQLLSLYEKGIIFSARNVQLLGRVGCLALGYGLLKAWGPALFSAWHQWINSTSLLSNSFLWGFYGLLSSPWIIGGLFLIVVSRIMDEGRKIQEEQELTV